jgi:uncharacterized phage protein (TIGR02220 family)
MWFDIDQFKAATKGMGDAEIGRLMQQLAKEGAPDQNQVQVVITYMNAKKDPAYRFQASNSHTRLIKARLKEHSIEDLLAVIDQRWEAWQHDKEMFKYFRPATLFNDEKFSSYVGQIGCDAGKERLFRETDYGKRGPL